MNDKTMLLLMRKMEEKLIELMGAEEYKKFATEIAREGFRQEIDGMADGEFKDFVKEHFDQITGGVEAET